MVSNHFGMWAIKMQPFEHVITVAFIHKDSAFTVWTCELTVAEQFFFLIYYPTTAQIYPVTLLRDPNQLEITAVEDSIKICFFHFHKH